MEKSGKGKEWQEEVSGRKRSGDINEVEGRKERLGYKEGTE